MRNYNFREKWQKLLTPEIVKKLIRINEYKGEQRLFIEAHKDELNELVEIAKVQSTDCLLYTSPSPRDPKTSRMPSSA